MEFDDHFEHELAGGNVAATVVRVGTTVRKPVTEATPNVEAFLQHLSEAGFLHAPRSLGRDEAGRQVLEFIPGETVRQPELLTFSDLQEIAAMIRELHRVSASFPMVGSGKWNVAIPSDAEELICHNDLGAWNLVRSEARWVFIDWDGSGPASRLWDLAYAAQSFVPLADGGSPMHDAIRLRHFVDAYGLDMAERERFVPLLLRRVRAGYELLENGARAGIQPWAGLYTEGHGDYWRKAADYVEEHEQVWATALLA